MLETRHIPLLSTEASGKLALMAHGQGFTGTGTGTGKASCSTRPPG